MEEDFKKALESTLGRKDIDSIVEQVMDSPARFDDLYALTEHEEEKIAWRATWACEKLSILAPSLLISKREELMQRAMQCPHGGIRRLLLNTLLHLPVPKPINVAFLDFCLNGMLSRRDCSRTSRMHETGICYLPERTRTDGRAGSLFGEYGTGILYRSRTMCTQQHSKENKEMNNQKIRMYNPGKIVNGEYVFE